MTRKTIFAMLVAALGAALIAGCATPAPTDTGPPAAAHNDADIAFTRDMLPHHRQAVEMAGMAVGRSRNPEVLALARQIGAGQAPEIDVMTGWLRSWGVATPPGGAGMSGMMSDDQMGQLQRASGAGFDRMFLQLMTRHHSGAVDMAAIELRDGLDPAATALARRITDTQQAEITRMTQLLTTV